MIPTPIHGILDYLVGTLLILAPFLLGFADGGPAQWVPQAQGAGVIAYSLLTRYEWGLVKWIPMPVHLALDGAGGLLLAASPWLFGFADQVWAPHLVLGIFELLVTALSSRRSGRGAAARRGAGAI